MKGQIEPAKFFPGENWPLVDYFTALAYRFSRFETGVIAL
jgi:hypothetical protein